VNALNNRLHFVDATTGELKHTIELDKYFWFPSIALMPDKHDPEILFEDIELPEIDYCDEEYTYDLTRYLDDKDNHNCNISVSLSEAMPNEETPSKPAAEISLNGKMLKIKPLANGSHDFTLMAESNGKVVSQNFNVMIGKNTSGIGSINTAGSVYSNGYFVAFRGLGGVTFDVYALDGRKVDSIAIDDDAAVIYPAYQTGIYILRGSNGMTAKIRIN
ncbi:MAG: hypothetical protein K2I25_04365, partial [Muribaculaceae bacterium]|nr:hypothetical protein [Muribaculaceae bacterium]